MAPPSTRRPGFSRRAQYGVLLGYVIAIGGVVISLLLVVAAIADPQGFSALRGAALDLTSPVTGGGRSAVNAVTGGADSVGSYFNAAQQNAELKRQLAASRQRVIEARAIEFENRQLKALLRLTRETPEVVVATRIVGSTFDPTRRLGTLSAGGSDGVRTGQPVRAAEGLIGRILETGRFASRVLLVTDGASTVPVQLVRDGTPALAIGRGDGTLELKTIEVGESPFKRGDIVVTSGVGGIYPPRVPVAIVTHSNKDVTIARPLADPARVDYAIVQPVYEPAAAQPVNAREAAQLGERR
jgi:rod shape-determining protein MreC